MTAKMQRRDFITLLGGAATWPLDAGAQQAGKIPRVGFMGNSTAALEANLIGPFRQGLREHGYEEGRNIETVFRWAEGKYERFPVLIAELVSAKVDMIVTAGTPASLAVKNANTSIPLIMIAASEPVATGLVASFARPGGNITGLTSMAPEIDGNPGGQPPPGPFHVPRQPRTPILRLCYTLLCVALGRSWPLDRPLKE
jgi:ABC transporter substrate binding protein